MKPTESMTVAEIEAELKSLGREADDITDEIDSLKSQLSQNETREHDLKAQLPKAEAEEFLSTWDEAIERLSEIVHAQHGGLDIEIMEFLRAGRPLSEMQRVRLGQLRTMYLL